MKLSWEYLLKCCSFLSIPWTFCKRFYSWSLVTCIILCMDDVSLWFEVCRFDYVHTFTGLVAGEFCRALLGLFPGVIVVADEISEVLFVVVKKFWRCFLNKELLLTFLEIWLEIRLSCQTSGSSWFQMDGSKIREYVTAPSLFHVPWGNQQSYFILSTPLSLSLKILPKKESNFKFEHFRLACVWISSPIAPAIISMVISEIFERCGVHKLIHPRFYFARAKYRHARQLRCLSPSNDIITLHYCSR